MSDNPVYAFRVGQLGDALVSLPALHALKHAIGDAPLISITDHFGARGIVPAQEVFHLTGFFDQYLSYTPLVISTMDGLRSLARVSRRIRQIGRGKLFLLIDPGRSAAQIRRYRFFFETVCGLELIGADAALNSYHPRGFRDRLLEQPSEYSRLRKIVTDYFGVERCGENTFSLPTRDEHLTTVNRLWEEVPVPANSIPIAVGPGSKMPSKRWKESRFIRLGTSLIRDYNVFPLIFGGPEDAEIGDRLINAWRRGFNFAGKLSIAEASVALSRCRFYVGNDTGTMHLAAVAGLPCVCLFSARDNPGRWNPVGKGHYILRGRIECEGCSAVSCPHGEPKCMDLITVEQVYDAAGKVLKSLQ